MLTFVDVSHSHTLTHTHFLNHTHIYPADVRDKEYNSGTHWYLAKWQKGRQQSQITDAANGWQL